LNGSTAKTQVQKENNNTCQLKQSTKSSITTIQKSTNQNTNGSIQQNQSKTEPQIDPKRSPLVVKKTTIKPIVQAVSNGVQKRESIRQKTPTTPTTPRKSVLNGSTTIKSTLNKTKSRTGSTMSLAIGNGKLDSTLKTRPTTATNRNSGMAKSMSAKIQPIAVKEPLKVQVSF